MLEYLIGIIVVLVSLYLCIARSNSYVEFDPDAKTVPFVTDRYMPFIGHGISFGKDIIGFVKSAQEKYGNIFAIKIFRKNLIVITDHEMKAEYFKATEDNMSLYDVLNQLFFGSAFSDSEENLTRIITLVKNTVKVNFDTFGEKIMDEASRMINRLQEKAGQELELTEEMIRFVACTSSRCFIGMELSDEFYDTLMKFAHLLNKVVVMTYFLPRSVLRFIFGRKLKSYRTKMIELMNDEIESYRHDPDKTESNVIRTAVNYTGPDGSTLTNEQIGEVIICLLYVSSENTALGLSSTFLDMVENSVWWQKATVECDKLISNYRTAPDSKKTQAIKELFSSKLLDAMVHESARMNTHIFPLGRRPVDRNVTIGGYNVGNTDTIALCPPMLMLHSCSKNADPLKYNPDRFISGGEKKFAQDVLTWGAGTHLCPGKAFAVYEIKAAIALLTTHFNLPELLSLGKIDYFSPSAFAERPAKVRLTIRDTNNTILVSETLSTANISSIIIDGIDHQVEKIIGENNNYGFLIRNFFNREKQAELYTYIYDLSKGSVEFDEISKSNIKHYPLTYYNLIYTKTSNCAEPIMLHELCNKIMNSLRGHTGVTNFVANSTYAQLYMPDSTLVAHRDSGVDWGVSISLGADTDFRFGDKTIKMFSGDIFIADFSKTIHAVDYVGDTVPGWWEQMENTFDRTRMSIQVRDIRNFPNNLMSREEYFNMISV